MKKFFRHTQQSFLDTCALAILKRLPRPVQIFFEFIFAHKVGVILFSTLVILGTVFTPSNFAYASFFDDIVNALFHFISSIFLTFARLFIALAIFALRFFIEVAAYNGHTLPENQTVALGWTMVRDIANMFFVVILLVIAFGTILGLEQFEWKKLTAKLIFAAIFVNFSKLIAGLIIDAAHVFTLTFLNAVALTAGGNLINMFQMDKIFGLIYRPGGGANPSGDSAELLLLAGSFMAMMFAFLTMMAIGAYLIIMVVRTMILWMLIILSPLAYITSVLPQTQRFAQEYWKEFTSYVVAAPMMVFFLWLSFATLGTGEVNTHIANNADQNIRGTGSYFKQGELGSAELQASISEVTTWENMANFILAFGFMMLGLEQVRKLNLRVGGAVIDAATGATTKLASYASGARAASFLGRKGVDLGVRGAKGVLGMAAQPFSRMGRETRFKAQKFLKENAISRDRKAADIEKDIQGGVRKDAEGKVMLDKDGKPVKLNAGRKFLMKRAASLMETRGRKEKKIEDWEEALKALDEEHKESYSTSSSPGGQAKQEARARRDAALALSKGKAVEKRIKATIALLDERDSKGELTKNAQRYRDMYNNGRNSEAWAKWREAELNEKTERDTAAEMDRLVGLGDIFTQEVRAQQEKKRQERLGSADYDTNKIRIAMMQEVLGENGDLSEAKVREAKNAAENAPESQRKKLLEEYDKKKTQRENVQRLLPAMVNFAGTQGSASFGGLLKQATTEKDGTQMSPEFDVNNRVDITDENIRKAQAKLLSGLLSQKVSADSKSLEKALELLKERQGGTDQDLDALLQQTINATSKVGADGDERFVALLKRDEKNGNIRLTDANNDKDREYIEEKRDYARAQVDTYRVQGISGMVDTVAGKSAAKSKRAQENIAQIFARLDPQNVGRIQDSTIKDLNAIFANDQMTGADIVSLVQKMLKENKRPGAIKALLDRTEYKEIAAQKNVPDMFTSNAAQRGPNQSGSKPNASNKLK